MEAGGSSYAASSCETLESSGRHQRMVGVGEQQSQQRAKEAAPVLPDKVTAKKIMELAERQKHRCALTGVLLTPQTAGIDHIIPLSKGGENSIRNCQIVHIEINRMKGLMTNAEFIETCQRVAQWSDAKNRNGTSMEKSQGTSDDF